MTMRNEVYSINEEDYNFDDIEDAIQQYLDECADVESAKDFEELYNNIVTVYRGDPKKYNASNFLSNCVIDDLKDNAYEDCGEFAENWLDDITDIEKKELMSYVKKAIDDWADKYNKQPNFYTVENVKELKIKVEIDDDLQLKSFYIKE